MRDTRPDLSGHFDELRGLVDKAERAYEAFLEEGESLGPAGDAIDDAASAVSVIDDYIYRIDRGMYD